MPSVPTSEGSKEEESDPFGLDALIPKNLKKDEKTRGKKDGAAKFRKEEGDENKRFLKSQREALIFCLEIAARRYKIPWSVLTRLPLNSPLPFVFHKHLLLSPL